MRAFVEKRRPDYMKLRRLAAEGGSSEFVWGAPSVTCPSCGATGLPAGFAFCGACGELVGAGAVEATDAPAGSASR